MLTLRARAGPARPLILGPGTDLGGAANSSPAQSSVVFESTYSWGDAAWMDSRKQGGARKSVKKAAGKRKAGAKK